jgi:hypothetical protein
LHDTVKEDGILTRRAGGTTWRLPSILTRKKRAGMSSFFIDK